MNTAGLPGALPWNCAEPLYEGVESVPVMMDRILLDRDTLKVGNVDFRIVHTPGHTPVPS